MVSLVSLLSGCRNSGSDFRLSGRIEGLGNDTLYIYPQEQPENGLDTIIARDGSFQYTLKVDTVTPLFLLVGNQSIPVYADKGLGVTVEGNLTTADLIQVKGGELNDELNEFRRSVSGRGAGEGSGARAESYIRMHKGSPASLYVLDRFFVQKEHPDYAKIKELIKVLSIDLQDNAAVKQLLELCDLQTGVEAGKSAPFFSSKDRNGKSVTFNDFKEKYLLITFWASWWPASTAELKALDQIAGKYKKKNLAFLGISLDLERNKWLEALKKDTVGGTQLTDLKGWESMTVKQYGIEKLPAIVLIGPDKKIISRDLTGKELANKLEEIFK